MDNKCKSSYENKQEDSVIERSDYTNSALWRFIYTFLS